QGDRGDRVDQSADSRDKGPNCGKAYRIGVIRRSPTLFRRSEVRAGLAAHDHPVNAAQVERPEILEERLHREEGHGGAARAERIEAPEGVAVLDAGAQPDPLRPRISRTRASGTSVPARERASGSARTWTPWFDIASFARSAAASGAEGALELPGRSKG